MQVSEHKCNAACRIVQCLYLRDELVDLQELTARADQGGYVTIRAHELAALCKTVLETKVALEQLQNGILTSLEEGVEELTPGVTSCSLLRQKLIGRFK